MTLHRSDIRIFIYGYYCISTFKSQSSQCFMLHHIRVRFIENVDLLNLLLLLLLLLMIIFLHLITSIHQHQLWSTSEFTFVWVFNALNFSNDTCSILSCSYSFLENSQFLFLLTIDIFILTLSFSCYQQFLCFFLCTERIVKSFTTIDLNVTIPVQAKGWQLAWILKMHGRFATTTSSWLNVSTLLTSLVHYSLWNWYQAFMMKIALRASRLSSLNVRISCLVKGLGWKSPAARWDRLIGVEVVISSHEVIELLFEWRH